MNERFRRILWQFYGRFAAPVDKLAAVIFSLVSSTFIYLRYGCHDINLRMFESFA